MANNQTFMNRTLSKAVMTRRLRNKFLKNPSNANKINYYNIELIARTYSRKRRNYYINLHTKLITVTRISGKQLRHYTPVELAQHVGNPGINSNTMMFGTVGKLISCRLTY